MKKWEDIEKHFIDLNNQGWKHERLLDLVRYILENSISNRLFGYTSLDKLLISSYETLNPNKDTLHISFNRETQQWNFVYYSVPYKEPEFTRVYPAEQGIEKLKSFIELIGW